MSIPMEEPNPISQSLPTLQTIPTTTGGYMTLGDSIITGMCTGLGSAIGTWIAMKYIITHFEDQPNSFKNRLKRLLNVHIEIKNPDEAPTNGKN